MNLNTLFSLLMCAACTRALMERDTPPRSATLDRLAAAAHFGEVGANNNHVIAYVGGYTGVSFLAQQINVALGQPPDREALCLDLHGADVQKEFRDLLAARHRGGSSYSVVLATGAEALLAEHDLNEDRARILDFLYLISDKSSPYRNVVVVVTWAVPATALDFADSSERFLLSALEPLASDSFNPRSFVGRLLAVHAGASDDDGAALEALCRASQTERSALSPPMIFAAWLCISCLIALLGYWYIARMVVVARREDGEDGEDGDSPRQHHISRSEPPDGPVPAGRCIALATRSHDAIEDELCSTASEESTTSQRQRGRGEAIRRLRQERRAGLREHVDGAAEVESSTALRTRRRQEQQAKNKKKTRQTM